MFSFPSECLNFNDSEQASKKKKILFRREMKFIVRKCVERTVKRSYNGTSKRFYHQKSPLEKLDENYDFCLRVFYRFAFFGTLTS